MGGTPRASCPRCIIGGKKRGPAERAVGKTPRWASELGPEDVANRICLHKTSGMSSDMGGTPRASCPRCIIGGKKRGPAERAVGKTPRWASELGPEDVANRICLHKTSGMSSDMGGTPRASCPRCIIGGKKRGPAERAVGKTPRWASELGPEDVANRICLHKTSGMSSDMGGTPRASCPRCIIGGKKRGPAERAVGMISEPVRENASVFICNREGEDIWRWFAGSR